MTENKQYWFCTIGPISKKKLGWGADGPLRSVVQSKFIEIFDEQADKCSSGWGLEEEMKTRLDIISLLPITDPKTLAEIDKLLSKRIGI
ncbi:hypothetical protein [Leptolyngbya phage Lbo-JY46]